MNSATLTNAMSNFETLNQCNVNSEIRNSATFNSATLKSAI